MARLSTSLQGQIKLKKIQISASVQQIHKVNSIKEKLSEFDSIVEDASGRVDGVSAPRAIFDTIPYHHESRDKYDYTFLV